MRCRAAPPRASPGRSAPSARRDGKAAAPLHAPRDRGGASGARVDSAGTGRGGVHGGGGLGPHCEPRLTPRAMAGGAHRRAVLGLSPSATRRRRASARLGDPRHGVGCATYAPGAAPGLRGGTGGPLGTSRRMCGGPDLAAQVKSLTLERVSFWYPATEAPALRDVSLEVAQGEIVALVGAVGAGASTVLLAAGDLAPRLTGGRIVGTVSRRERSAIVLPTPWTQVSGLASTVWDEVAFGPANLGWPKHEIARQVDRVLEQLDLGPLATRDPATLSGGALQRVIIAATLALDSGLGLLDEPAAELDAEGARALWRLIRVLAKEGKAVLLATSALDALPDVADRVVWLEDGAVRAVGTPELLADVAACAAGLGTSVATVWGASGLPGPYPLTVAHAVRRWR